MSTPNSSRSGRSTSAWRPIDDWQILHALHAADEPWDGLITTDARMLSLPKELALLCQTKLTLVVAEAVGHDPIKATGLILAHLGRICEQTRSDRAQMWRLRTNTRPAEDPWDLVTRVADRRGETAADLYARERLKPAELRRSPLHDDDK